MSLRTAEWKLVFNAYSDKKELYKLTSKAGSAGSVLIEDPDKQKNLLNKILEHLEKYDQAYSKERLEEIELDDELKKQLKDLGYL